MTDGVKYTIYGLVIYFVLILSNICWPVSEVQQRYKQEYGHCKDTIQARGEK